MNGKKKKHTINQSHSETISDVCNSGTEEIMKFLCSESGQEYLPPSNFLLNVLDNTKPGTSVGSPASKVFEEEENLMRKLEGYSNMMVSKVYNMSLCIRISDQVRHKPACTVTEAG